MYVCLSVLHCTVLSFLPCNVPYSHFYTVLSELYFYSCSVLLCLYCPFCTVLSVCMSVCLSVLYVCVVLLFCDVLSSLFYSVLYCTGLPACLPACPPACMSVWLPVWLSVRLSVISSCRICHVVCHYFVCLLVRYVLSVHRTFTSLTTAKTSTSIDNVDLFCTYTYSFRAHNVQLTIDCRSCTLVVRYIV